jgi:fructoselysine-6-P-deglycase FrlB-like protein
LLDVTNDPHGPASTAAALAGCDRIVVVGTGADHVSARALALKITEGARQPGTAHDLESVLHGHLAAATRWTGLVLVASDPASTSELVQARAAAVLRAAKLIGMPAAAILGEAVGQRTPKEATPAGRVVIPTAGRVAGAAASLLGAVIPLQLLAERLARARGVDPDTIGREDPGQAAAHS